MISRMSMRFLHVNSPKCAAVISQINSKKVERQLWSLRSQIENHASIGCASITYINTCIGYFRVSICRTSSFNYMDLLVFEKKMKNYHSTALFSHNSQLYENS